MSNTEEAVVDNNEQQLNGEAEETPKDGPSVVDNEKSKPDPDGDQPEEPKSQNGDGNPEPTLEEPKENDQRQQQQQQDEGEIQPQEDKPSEDKKGEKDDSKKTPEKSEEEKRAEELRKKEEKQREKERKQKEKEAKEEQKKRAKEEKALKKKRKREAEVEVVLLDGTKQEFVVPRKCKAAAIFDEVYKHLDISEQDYFGLYYLDNNMKVYIDPLKTAKRQIPVDEDGVWRLCFGVKYYIEDPTILKEDITRYQYVLQICQDIKDQRIKATKEQVDELLSLVIQSSVGDHNEEEHPAGYTEEFQRYFYAKKEAIPENVEETVRELHKTKREMAPDQCEVEFLKLAQALPRYGVHTYSALDSRQTQSILGISFRGISLYQEAKEIHKFDWSDIVRVGFSKKKFKIWFDPSVQNPENMKPVLLDLFLHNQAAAKRLWVICAEQHTFFRRSAPVSTPKAVGFFSFKRGSKFRYSGRTLKQMKEATAREDQPEFKRTYSERYSKPAKKKIRRTGSLDNVGAGTVVTAEVPPQSDRPESGLNEEQTAEVVRTFLKTEHDKVDDEEPSTERTEEPAPVNEPEETPQEPEEPPQEPQETPQEPQEETVKAVEEPQTESQPPPQQSEEEPPSGGDQPPAEQNEDNVVVAEQTMELGDPEDPKEVEDDAKVLVDNVIEDATKKVSEEN